ncbi:Piso0_005512 [Millerozyma farinosa CBS 7064]|uniref:Piso0_005512 protein n=1 Tax=Pichia sorbitophila (strain ATCC MYA-4447 / BCRC 22081 / CBS 7064 / NBRC 10061 / NRRL Y-12695) TaxID=559304 RepID=G8XZ78_PICSO|nr:Piso0_005512 [Millerozyma farinosa CBS 7064]
MSAVEQFESILKEISTLKAPGVSGSRIKKLSEIAIKNVNEESKLITILYSNCKATPSSHKLGSLYVVDAIVRAYIEEAKKLNEEISPSAPEGTYASAVCKVSELIESLIDDALELTVSKSQIIKIGKLVDIWERAETFKPEIIKSIRDKHFASTTPPGSPPSKPSAPLPNGLESNSTQSVPSSNYEADSATAKSENDTASNSNESSNANNNNSILSALASLAKQSNSQSSTPNAAPAVPVQQPSSQTMQQPPSNNANDILSQLSAMANNSAQPQAPANNGFNQAAQPPAQAQPQTGSNEQYIFNMLQQMQSGNSNAQYPRQQQADYGSGRRGRDDNNVSSYSRRNRSRSPNRFGSGNRRERSPPRNQINQMNQQRINQLQNNGYYPSGGELNLPNTPHFRPRNVGFDPSLPQGSFKVLSRTLFIGGVPRNMDEKELAAVLRPFAEVQSVILNSERKHAFVKVYSRREAEQVITSFNKDNSLPLRTRWGVGFGPRDCCNYQHGISIIPISRLTDADRTWVVQAQWGGTGGQPLQSGMVIDEPDIEIGAGISSKAMSKKMPTNSARNGPKSNKPGEPEEDYVKTTLIPQSSSTMSHGLQPDFQTLTQSSVNPLSGLFANANPNISPQPVPGQTMPMPNMMQQQNGAPAYPQMNDFLNTLNQGGGNPNLSAQLATFFQNGGMNGMN